MLPSELLSRGNTLDINVAGLGVDYETYLNKKSENGHTPQSADTEELQKMLDRVREKKK